MELALEILLPPFVACLVLTGIHTYLGLHVVARGVIFVALALAQVAALGATFAFLLGYDAAGTGGYLYSLAFAFLGATVFSLSRLKDQRVPQEAIIGITFAVASAATILIADRAPEGSELIQAMLAGSLLWVPWSKILGTAAIYAAIGAFHWAYRDRFLALSMNPAQAEASGWNVRLWDFLFYMSFGFVITSSVSMAGVLLVFSFLVIPAVIAMLFATQIRSRLMIGWATGTLVSMIGLALSYAYDLPSGPAVVGVFGVAMALAATARYTASAARPAAALARVGIVAIAALIATLVAVRTAPISAVAPLTGGVGSVASTVADSAAPATGAERVTQALAELRNSSGTAAQVVSVIAESGVDIHELMASGWVSFTEDDVAALREVPGADALNVLHEIAFHAPDAWARLRAAENLVTHAGTLGDDALLQLMEGDNPALLKAEANEALEAATGQDFAFDALAPDRQAEAIARWRAWLIANPSR